jgi:hypothetical protein
VAQRGKKAPAKKVAGRTLRDREGAVRPEVLTDINRVQEIWKTVRSGVVGFFCVGGIAATYLPAHALAGYSTNVNVNVAIGLTIAFSVAGGGGVSWGYRQKQKFDDADRRRKQLEGELSVKNKELTAANRRIEELESDPAPAPRGGKRG